MDNVKNYLCSGLTIQYYVLQYRQYIAMHNSWKEVDIYASVTNAQGYT